jgi:proteasome assembly chaperone 3
LSRELTQISIPLSNPLPRTDFTLDEDEMELSPPHLNPRFLLGVANDLRGEIAQLYAVQIASLVVRQSPDERRTLLVGVGLQGKLAADGESEEARRMIYAVLDMVGECRIW